jgi:hypothetical protein
VRPFKHLTAGAGTLWRRRSPPGALIAEESVKGAAILLACLISLAIFVKLSTQPDEPCRVEAASAEGRATGQPWCDKGGGVYTLVTVKNDANRYVILLQFSKKGERTWKRQRNQKFLNVFRRFTDEVAGKDRGEEACPPPQLRPEGVTTFEGS